MKNIKFLLFAIALFATSASFAQFQNARSVNRSSSAASFSAGENGLKSGYKGFVEAGYTVGLGDFGMGRVCFTTSHGYQINPHFFVGVGAGVSYYHEGSFVNVPLFANFRGTILKGNITPYIDFKAGYSVVDLSGFYCAPSVGCRFGIGKRTALTFSMGYEVQLAEVSYRYYEESVNTGGLSFRLGLDF